MSEHDGRTYFVATPSSLPGSDPADGAEYEELPGAAGVSIIVEAITRAGIGPRLHRHPYAETFVVRRGSVTFTVGSDTVEAGPGQVLVVPAMTPHRFTSGPDGYEGVHIHASVRFITEWLE